MGWLGIRRFRQDKGKGYNKSRNDEQKKKMWEKLRSLNPSFFQSSFLETGWRIVIFSWKIGGMDGGPRPNGFVVLFGPG